MDGRGRIFDNIFTERLWRSVKYEEVYIKDYQVAGMLVRVWRHLHFYNNRRYHQALEYKHRMRFIMGSVGISKEG